jgi:hypothetical protein
MSCRIGPKGLSANRRYLQHAGGHDITGEKLRSESAEAKAALARQRRYHVVAGNLEGKEVVLDAGMMRDRFLVCRNPDEATRAAREARLRPGPDPDQPPFPGSRRQACCGSTGLRSPRTRTTASSS